MTRKRSPEPYTNSIEAPVYQSTSYTNEAAQIIGDLDAALA
jgi:hypothetical protein